MDIAERVKFHAECVVGAMGFRLDVYDAGQRKAVLSCVMDAYEEAYRAGARRVQDHLTPKGPDNEQ